MLRIPLIRGRHFRAEKEKKRKNAGKGRSCGWRGYAVVKRQTNVYESAVLYNNTTSPRGHGEGMRNGLKIQKNKK